MALVTQKSAVAASGTTALTPVGGPQGSTARWRTTGRTLWRRLGPGTLSVVGVLVLWQILSGAGILPQQSLPSVTQMISALWALLGTSSFWSDVGGTLQGWGIGLAIAAALAVPIGILLGTNDVLNRMLSWVIEFMRPIPSVAIIPLVVLVYGTSLKMKVFLVAYACFWPLLIQTIYGVRSVDPVARDTARSFRLGRLQMLYRITLPSALPSIATGLRVSSAIALILTVTAELVVGANGLGKAILVAQSGGAIAEMYALIAVTGFVGLSLNAVFQRSERRLLRWHASQRIARVEA